MSAIAYLSGYQAGTTGYRDALERQNSPARRIRRVTGDELLRCWLGPPFKRDLAMELVRSVTKFEAAQCLGVDPRDIQDRTEAYRKAKEDFNEGFEAGARAEHAKPPPEPKTTEGKPAEGQTVHLLLDVYGKMLGVYADKAVAEAVAARYNNDSDEAAPYRVETWSLQTEE